MRKQLLDPVLESGVRSTNYFNGRLLTAQDLQADQEANRKQHAQLGRAIGEGVGGGLFVRLLSPGSQDAAPSVAVTAGLGINRAGQVLSLGVDVEVALVRESQIAASEAGLFAECVPPKARPSKPATGAYVLAMTPASGFLDSVPVRGNGANAAVSGCGSRYVVEGVKFLLAPIDAPEGILPKKGTALTDAGRSRLRNLLAHHCFGTETLARQYVDPLAAPAGYGAIDQARSSGLQTDCDLPLALLYWSEDGVVEFVDVWPVRRPPLLVREYEPWDSAVGSRRSAEGSAVFLQFQQQIEELADRLPNAGGARGPEFFRYLPAAGLMPIQGKGSPRGFDARRFFGKLGSRGLGILHGNHLRGVLDEGLRYDPIDLEGSDPVQLYLIRENLRANKRAVAAGEAHPLVLLFTSSALPYRGVAHFGESEWDRSRFASVVI